MQDAEAFFILTRTQEAGTLEDQLLPIFSLFVFNLNNQLTSWGMAILVGNKESVYENVAVKENHIPYPHTRA